MRANQTEFIKPGFVKTSMKIIDTMYKENLYLLVIYYAHCTILNVFITRAVLKQIQFCLILRETSLINKF